MCGVCRPRSERCIKGITHTRERDMRAKEAKTGVAHEASSRRKSDEMLNTTRRTPEGASPLGKSRK